MESGKSAKKNVLYFILFCYLNNLFDRKKLKIEVLFQKIIGIYS